MELITRKSNNYAEGIANTIIDNINNMGINLVENHKLCFNYIWNNENATPEEIVKALDKDAVFVFKCALNNLQFLTNCASGCGKSLNDFLLPIDYTPHKVVNFNQDGTITLTPLP